MAFQKKPVADPNPDTLGAATLPPTPSFKPDFTKRAQAPVEKPKVDAKVLRRPAPASQTELPKALIDYYRDQGCQVHFVWADPRLLAQESTYGRYPIQIEDLPPEIVKEIKPWFEDPAKHAGQLRRSDAVAVYQSLDARDGWRLEAMQQEQMREAAFMHQGEEIEARLRGAGLRGTVDASRVGPIASHIIGGPELMKMLEDDGADAAGPG